MSKYDDVAELALAMKKYGLSARELLEAKRAIDGMTIAYATEDQAAAQARPVHPRTRDEYSRILGAYLQDLRVQGVFAVPEQKVWNYLGCPAGASDVGWCGGATKGDGSRNTQNKGLRRALNSIAQVNGWVYNNNTRVFIAQQQVQ